MKFARYKCRKLFTVKKKKIVLYKNSFRYKFYIKLYYTGINVIHLYQYFKIYQKEMKIFSQCTPGKNKNKMDDDDDEEENSLKSKREKRINFSSSFFLIFNITYVWKNWVGTMEKKIYMWD